MTFSRQSLRRAVVWGGAALLSTGVLVYAFNPQPDPPGHYYGLMTLPATQTMAVHVSNISRPITEIGDVTLARTSPTVCNAEVQIVNQDGLVLASDSQRVMPTESFSLNFTVPSELPPSPICPSDPSRESAPCMQLRAQVLFSGGGSHCVSSVEVGSPFGSGDSGNIRASGGFEHPAMIVGFNPQPDPPIAKPAQ